MKTSRIFVSHSHHDSAFGLRLVESLRERLGADAVWYDESGGLHGGDEWWDKIVAEITARDTFLVILSPNALASKWVPKEMSIAYRLHVELGHRLLPLLLLPCQQRADWAIIQSIDFADYPATYEQKLSEVLDALKIDATQPLAPTVVEARSPLAQRWAEEAFSAFGQENWSVVVDKTDLLIKSHDMTAALWRIRGLTLQTQGDQSHALWALDESLKLEAHDVATMRAKGRALSAMRNYRVAIETLTEAQAIPATDDAETRLPLLGDLCDALMEYGHLSEVLRRVDDALRLAPDDVTWLKRKLEAFRQSKPWPDTLALARSMRLSQPVVVSQWVDEHYEISKQRGRPSEWIDFALEATPNDHVWLRRKLDMLEQSLGWSGTLTPIRDLLMREPIVVEQWLEHLEQTQQWRNVLGIYDLMLEANPNDAGLFGRKIHALEQIGWWDEQTARQIARTQLELVMQ